MKRPRLSWGIFAATIAVLWVAIPARAVLVTDPNDPRTWQGAGVGTFAQLVHGSNTLATRTQVVNDQLLDDGIFNPTGYLAATLLHTNWSDGISGGDHLGGGTIGRSFDTTGTGSYAYGGAGTDVFTAGNTIDDLWFQSSNRIGDTVFDLGFQATKAAVFNTIDHGPLPGEAIESTVWLSNDLTNWTQGVLERVWLEGFSPILGIQWDGFVYAVGTGTNQTFRYASITHGGPGALLNDGDDEINGIMGLDAGFGGVIPEPVTALTAMLAISALGRYTRKRVRA